MAAGFNPDHPGFAEPALQLSPTTVALLALAFRAGVSESPGGFDALQQIRRVVSRTGIDIADVEDEQTQFLVDAAQRALDVLDRRAASA